MSRLLKALSDRAHEEDVSFRTRMLELAATLPDVIALGRGDPDFHTPAHIVDAAKKAIDANEHHYTHPAGLPKLREAISASLKGEYGLDYASDEIIVTAGTQEAVMLCMLALIEKGDEVLLPAPRFTSYDTAVTMCGGVVVEVPTREDDDYALVPAEVEAQITPRTKVLVLITPNNPTGAVTPPDMVREIARIAIARDIIVMSDEIYAKIIFDGSEHLSIATLPGMRDRTITLNGFSKSYAMTGWRVGYVAAPRDVVRRLVEPRHTLSINAATPSQFAALAALTGPQEPVDAMVKAYAERRTFMMQALDRLGFTYGHPGGAFYVYTNVSASGRSAPDFCEMLLREARVLVFPGTMFADPEGKHIRISLLQPLARMEEAVRRIEAVKDRLFVG
ncbi:MAG: pyridoxal phosphate-dependent aminotransferase [Hyphomicrobiales bacterium]|nr:pyridoxal phosphate-dependent aminotransferase [Hyphomicrobiales bacterium]